MELARPHEPLTASSIVKVWAANTSKVACALNVPHCSDPTSLGEAVDAGKGVEFEQLIPEHGLGRPRAGCSAGN
jgi:hypothetical protein